MTAYRPEANIRRFDVFAEWSRLVGRERKHMSEEDAERYGYAVARIVAARKFSGYEPGQVTEWKRRARRHDSSEPWWEHVAKPDDFGRKIVERMGRRFYDSVFKPAIRRAWDSGKSYEEIRDTLRDEWNEGLRTSTAPGGRKAA